MRILSASLPLSVAVSIALAATAAAQPDQSRRAKEAAYKKDPDTADNAALVKKAGYVSLGPFEFGDQGTTEDLRRLMPSVPFIFVETAHFKIGSSLPPLRMPKTSPRSSEVRRCPFGNPSRWQL